MKKISLTLALAAALTLGAAGLASAETPVSRTYMDSLIRAEHQDQNFRRPPVRHYGPGPVMQPQAQQPAPEAKPEAQPPQDFKAPGQPPQDFRGPGQPPQNCPPPEFKGQGPENCPPDFRGNPPARPECAENAPAPEMQPPRDCPPPPGFRGGPRDGVRHPGPGPRQGPPPEFRGEHHKEVRHHDGEKRDKEFRHRKEHRGEFRGERHERRDFRPPRECHCDD